MRHVPSPILRRLVDEPMAVPDHARRHLAGCERCQTESSAITGDAAVASRLLSAPREISDVDLEWILLQERLREPDRAQRRVASRPWRMPRRLAHAPVGAGTAAVAAVLVIGAGAAAALTTIYAPTRVAPVRVNQSDLQAIASITGISPGQLSGGLPPSGSMRLAFGELSWSTAGHAQQVSSIARASALTHLAYSAPATLPAGVGSPSSIAIQPQVTATVHFSQSAGPAIGGSTLQITGGPAIVVQYGSRSARANLTTLAIVAMQRPVASSTGATASQLETFLLSRRGVPAGLAQELRQRSAPGPRHQARGMPWPCPGPAPRHEDRR